MELNSEYPGLDIIVYEWSNDLASRMGEDLEAGIIDGIIVDEPLAHYISAMHCDLVIAGDEVLPYYYNWVFSKYFSDDYMLEILLGVYELWYYGKERQIK